MENNESIKKEKKQFFFSRVLLSVKDFEKYPEFAEEPTKKTFSYIFKLILIFSIFASISFVIEILKNNITTYFHFENVYLNYISVFIVAYLILIILYFLATLLDILILSIIGHITSKILKLKLTFRKIYNISAYAITFPMIINAIYFIVNACTNFTIKYFQVMYIAISYIYVMTALLIIKSDDTKNENSN